MVIWFSLGVVVGMFLGLSDDEERGLGYMTLGSVTWGFLTLGACYACQCAWEAWA